MVIQKLMRTSSDCVYLSKSAQAKQNKSELKLELEKKKNIMNAKST